MTESLVERVAKTIAKAEITYYGPRSTLEQCMNWANEPECYRQAARDVITEILEEIAQWFEGTEGYAEDHRLSGADVASDIRNLYKQETKNVP